MPEISALLSQWDKLEKDYRDPSAAEKAMCQFLLDNSNKIREFLRSRKLPRTPTPEMVAAGWEIVDKNRTGVGRLGPGLGIREIWEAMYDAGRKGEAFTDV